MIMTDGTIFDCNNLQINTIYDNEDGEVDLNDNLDVNGTLYFDYGYAEGVIDMNSNQVSEVGNPTDGNDAMSRDYADGRYVNTGAENGAWVSHGSYISPRINGADRTGVQISDGNDITCDVLHANKVDPTVQIDGQLYVTWMAENIGFWIDIISEGQLKDGEFTIDFEKQPVGSDLWLWWRTIAEGTAIPLVTAQDPAILIANVKGSVLTVKSISGDEDARFSFRLSGKRLDEAKKSSDEINRPEEDTNIYIDLDKFDRQGNPK